MVQLELIRDWKSSKVPVCFCIFNLSHDGKNHGISLFSLKLEIQMTHQELLKTLLSTGM